MLRMTTCAVFALAALGCGAEPTVVEYAEVCGEAAPFRVLELAPGERLTSRPLKIGDRVAYFVGRGTPEEASRASPLSFPTAVWTTGPCGEAPRKLADEVDWVFTIDLEQWPALLLACDAAAGELRVLDPEGAAAPHVLFTGVPDCNRLHWAAQGLVSVMPIMPNVEGEEDPKLAIESLLPETGTLQWHRYPEDPYHDTVAAAPLLTVRLNSRTGQSSSRLLRVFQEYVLAVTPEDALVRVDLGDGAVTLVQSGVAEFDADYIDGRYMLWQDATPTDEDIQYPAGQLFLRDRSDGSDVFLGEGALAYSWGALRYIERGLIFLELDATRMFSLPDLGFTDLPRVGRVQEMIDDHRVLMESWRGLSVVDIVTGEATTLYRGEVSEFHIVDEGVELLQVPICCINDNTRREAGPLWFIPYEGAPRRLVARATTWGHTLADGRRVDMAGIRGDWRGALNLMDPDTHETLRIDNGVFVNVNVVPEVFGADVVVYSIPGGERAGVWLARMPARP